MINLQSLSKKLKEEHLRVLEALDIEVSKINTSYYSCCPVHDESDNKKAFSVSSKTGKWKCWTRDCSEEYGNDMFGLIRGVLSKRSGSNVTFTEVLSWVRKNLPEFIDLSIKIEENGNTTIIDPFEDILNKFKEVVPSIAEGKGMGLLEYNVPSEYFSVQRHFSKEVLEAFDVGDYYGNLKVYKNRAIIPIHNDDGSKIIGYIGRGIKDFIEPKFYIERGFEKSNWLYNFHRAKEIAEKTNCMFLVEGQGDVWRLWEAGVHNVVGLFGKEIYENQIFKLNQLGITTLVILLDHDQPGREAKIKIKRKLDRYFKLIFPEVNTRKDIGEMPPEEIKENILIKLRGLY
jgi:DNA primase